MSSELCCMAMLSKGWLYEDEKLLSPFRLLPVEGMYVLLEELSFSLLLSSN